MFKLNTIFRTYLVAALVAITPIVPALGQSVSKEAAVKAAFVFNFIKFVEWPDKVFSGSETPIKLCVWGRSALDGALNALRNKTAKNRVIRVLYTQEEREASRCHILFIARTGHARLETVISQTTGKNVLTVSDIPDFARSGGTIGLFQSEHRMRFAINVDAARRSGLRISSQLLKLGKIVSSEEQ
ncbi:MAG: YfiR family protein [Rhodospirillaceae bacterium]|nr:YfiR family protein [Rhodospirillaceae bacterium]MBT5458073.1 YfiR family protein [Rhodospirillaceae bacterium]